MTGGFNLRGIRERLLACLGALVLGLLFVTVTGWLSMNFVTERYNAAIRAHVEPLRDLKLLSDRYGLGMVEILQKTRLNRARQDDAARTIEQALTDSEALWRRIVAPLSAGNELAVVHDIEPYRLAATQLGRDAVAILHEGDDAALGEMLDLRLYPVMEPLIGQLNALSQIEIDAIERERGDLRGLLRRMRLAYLVIVLGGLGVAALATAMVLRRVVAPIGRISEVMLRLADGQLDAPLPTMAGDDEVARLARATGVFRDTAREQAAQADELRIARDQAEDATRAKSAFLAMMSHEIRTPMNGVMAMAEMLDQTALTDDQRGMLGVVRSSGTSLLSIINDILDFSKIEAGKLDLEILDFPLAETVEEAAELVVARAEEKGLDLVVQIDPALPATLRGDPTRLRQVLINLAGNAVKFTERGEVTLSARLLPAEGGRDARLRLAVTDTGIGLTVEQQARLFQPFQQADTSTSRRYGGTGLGLSICRRLVDLMGGDIGIHSAVGEGSTFWLELPLGRAEAPDRLTPEQPEIDIADAHVLAVGFQGTGAEALRQALTAAGVADLAQVDFDADLIPLAVAADVVLLNAQASGDHALAAARHLAGTGRPLVLAAPRILASTLAEADRIGLFATVTRPLRRRRLWRVVAAALGLTTLERAQPTRVDNSSGWAPPPHDEARAAGALVLVAEDNVINQTVIRRMLNQRGFALDLAKDGREALEMWRRDRYGLLLTDFHMPEMDGFALTAHIRAAEREQGTDQRLPIVALTADALPGTEQNCLDHGMDGYLSKPIDTRALDGVLDRFLPQARRLRRPATAAAAPAIPVLPDVDPALFDFDRLLEPFGGRTRALTDGGAEAKAFLTAFLGSVPALMAAADTALAAGDMEAARHAAHILKGAARSVGAVRLGQVAADLQDVVEAGDPDTGALLASLLPPTYEELLAALGPWSPGPVSDKDAAPDHGHAPAPAVAPEIR
ncbi:ATP-binding protein [Nitrospirillum sp. BR 11164]|uniref:ATP-binding protein n=1 Tax=Nitrospirillum sp. BR 11164 TaxID=3104324 RepID=UPI002AFEE092|nr:ATP-binding protein [Nitrospirillum sp. BR 11164]MEA1648289.1 ATP-binding protein [Nitrospirillum sp. BR 11164]